MGSLPVNRMAARERRGAAWRRRFFTKQLDENGEHER